MMLGNVIAAVKDELGRIEAAQIRFQRQCGEPGRGQVQRRGERVLASIVAILEALVRRYSGIEIHAAIIAVAQARFATGRRKQGKRGGVEPKRVQPRLRRQAQSGDGQTELRGQLVLELEPARIRTLEKEEAPGLIEALADLLLEALGAKKTSPTNTEGVDEHENHA